MELIWGRPEAIWPFRGIVHVGANDGEEIPWYLNHGLSPVMVFEPHPEALVALRERVKGNPAVEVLGWALGARTEELRLAVPDNGDHRMATALTPIPGDEHLWTRLHMSDERVTVPSVRFDALTQLDLDDYNCLVIDVQGMELDVLKGFGKCLDAFDYLAVECSATPLYEGEAPAEIVCQWLYERGFNQISPILSHNDIQFVRSRRSKLDFDGSLTYPR